MFEEIYKQIKAHDTIVIVRHIGVDPDAMSSQIALRDSIRLTFPSKKVYALGNGSSKFGYIGSLDKYDTYKDALLIVLDTPNISRVDILDLDSYDYKIKIDHHQFIEKFCDLELIDTEATSASQIVLELINNTNLKMNENIARTLFIGIMSDTNRFLYNASPRVFKVVSEMVNKYKFDMEQAMKDLYSRPIDEARLEGYIAQNMIINENKFGYIILTNEIIEKLGVDSASSGNIINNFSGIEELNVWAFVTEDIKNDIIRINIRSNGPIVNKVAEKYNGGGHKLASGVRVKTIEEAKNVLYDLNLECIKYKEENNK